MELQFTISFYRPAFDLSTILAQNIGLSLFLVSIALLALALSFIYLIKSVINRQKKGELMKSLIMPEIAAKFGKIISVPGGGTILDSNNTVIFERESTAFEAKIVRVDIGNRFTSRKTDYEIRFNLPELREKFYIRNKHTSFMHGSEYPPDCRPVLISAIPADISLHCFNPQFLERLLEEKSIVAEIYKYLNTEKAEFRIAFEDGVFMINWNFGVVEDEKVEAEKLEQICQTAVVFYDKLSTNRF